VAEWLNANVLKAFVPGVPGVQIPLSLDPGGQIGKVVGFMLRSFAGSSPAPDRHVLL
jgi:hypothetical protein